MLSARRSRSSPALPGMTWEAGGAVSYVSPGKFSVAGVDATTRYRPGVIVYIPGAVKPFASVLWAEYSTDTTVHVQDAACYSGMAAVAYLDTAINPTNLCTGGTPLSGGDQSGSWPKGNVFDGTINARSNCWLSQQTGTGVSGVSYIGYQFSAAKSIRWFRILQANGPAASINNESAITSVKVQYSDNGSSWTDHETVTLIMGLHQLYIMAVPAASHVYWRLLANANPSSDWWGVVELEMGE